MLRLINCLEIARFSLADYFFSLDSDALLADPNTISALVDKEMQVVSPLLTSIGLYTNFWAGMTETFYYRRTDEYKQILNRKRVGCFEVPMVHTAVLIDLRHTETDLLTYLPDNIPNYPGPEDDIIVFALSATLNTIPLNICNDLNYGTLSLPLEEGQTLSHDFEILRYTLSEVTARNLPIIPTSFPDDVLLHSPESNKMGFDEIFMINLKRRVDRYERMA